MSPQRLKRPLRNLDTLAARLRHFQEMMRERLQILQPLAAATARRRRNSATGVTPANRRPSFPNSASRDARSPNPAYAAARRHPNRRLSASCSGILRNPPGRTVHSAAPRFPGGISASQNCRISISFRPGDRSKTSLIIFPLKTKKKLGYAYKNIHFIEKKDFLYLKLTKV
jgi:hypothetical protein